MADSDRFCGGCGTALASACRQCGGPLHADAAFCTACGSPRPDPTPAGTETEDRRQVSVLFVDLVDFTPYAERSDPELVRRLQNGFHDTVRRVVGQFGGVVEKYIGDAVMALFGAPVATESDALRCVRAGLELHRVYDDRASTDRATRLRFRVGVATGEALVDISAAHHGGQRIVAGDVVNTAARLQAMAPESGVLVCGRTHAVTADEIRYDAQSTVTLRGRTTPTELWLAREPVAHPRSGARPDLTAMVDRVHELDLLTGALDRVVRDRTAQLVTLFGHPGIGKTRLVRELRGRAGEVVWRTGNCRPFGENVTYAGLADIVKAQAGILDTDDVVTTRRRLAQSVRQAVSGPEADRLTESLQPLVGLPGPHLPGDAEEAESAWRRFLMAMARQGPTVLVFEDLHWADEAMLRFIELLAAAARETPLLLLCTSRPELVDRDRSLSGTIARSLTITLAPLPGADMTTLCRQLLGDTNLPEEAQRPLVELTNGNPLYAHEYVRMLADRSAAGSSDGELADLIGALGSAPLGTGPLGAAPDSAPMPHSVHAVIANRLDLLDPADRAVLQAAAVVGMQFWPAAVAVALGRPAGSVERSLRRLEQREFISEQIESTMAGQREFRFGHVLVRDVAYQRLPRAERVHRHERTADWLEQVSQHRGADLAEVLAYHRWAACEISRTVEEFHPRYATAARRALHLAARRAYALHAWDTAGGHVARALALVPSDPSEADPAVPDPEPERLRLELLATEIAFYRDRSTFVTLDRADQLPALAGKLAARVGPIGGDTAASAQVEAAALEAARAWTLLGQVSLVRGEYPVALDCLRRAIVLFDSLPDSLEKVDAYGVLGRLHMLSYECGQAIAAAGTAASIARRLGLAEAHAQARITIATARYECGDLGGLAELEEIAASCRADRLLALPRAIRNLAHVVCEEGDWPRSAELLAESRRLEVAASRTVSTDYAGEIMRAYFAGDLPAIAAAGADARTRWAEARGVVACVRLLRGETLPATGTDGDVAAQALADARACGFHRELWYGLAMTALFRALQRRYAEATALLGELSAEWQKVSVIASGGWVTPAAFAAALSGREPSELLRAPLAALTRHTPWARAALHTVTGAVALAEGRAAEAGHRHLAAAAGYAGIPTVTDRMLSLALAAAAFARTGEPPEAAGVLAELREFADRSGAPGLLHIASGRP